MAIDERWWMDVCGRTSVDGHLWTDVDGRKGPDKQNQTEPDKSWTKVYGWMVTATWRTALRCHRELRNNGGQQCNKCRVATHDTKYHRAANRPGILQQWRVVTWWTSCYKLHGSFPVMACRNFIYLFISSSSHLLVVSSTSAFTFLLLFMRDPFVFDSWKALHSLFCLCSRFSLYLSLRKRCLFVFK